MTSTAEGDSPTEELLSRLSALSSYEFEYFIAALWEILGWTTTVTEQSADGGVDIVATMSFPIDLKIWIEAKQYRLENKISVPKLRQYALPQGAEADCSVIVTTSSFTPQAVSEANATNTKTIDGEQLARIIRELNAEELLSKFLDAKDVSRVIIQRHVPGESPNDGVDPRETQLATAIRGMHAGHSEQLARLNIDSIDSMATVDPEEIAEETNISEARLERWVNQATYLANRPVDRLDDIGSKRAKRLQRIGLSTLGDLAVAEPDEIAQATNYGDKFGNKLKEQAATRPGMPVDKVNGIGEKWAEELASIGIDTIGDFAVADPEEIASSTRLGEAFIAKKVENV